MEPHEWDALSSEEQEQAAKQYYEDYLRDQKFFEEYAREQGERSEREYQAMRYLEGYREYPEQEPPDL